MISFLWFAIGVSVGVLAMGFMRRSSHDEECRSCKAYYTAIIKERDEIIHGLKSTRGKLAKELQNMSFMNSGYRAR